MVSALTALIVALPASAWELVEVSKDAATYEEGGRSTRRYKSGAVKPGDILMVSYRNNGYAGVLGGALAAEVEVDALKTIGECESIAKLEDPDGWTYLRSGPGTDHKPVGKLDADGTRIFVLKSGEWSKVMTEDGRKGFVHQSRLRPFMMDNQDSSDKRELASTIAEHRSGEGTVVVHIGKDAYYYNPGSKTAQHKIVPGYPHTGRSGDWALCYSNELTKDGHWRFFGGVPNWIVQRTNQGWQLKAFSYDGVVSPVGAEFRDGEVRELATPHSVPASVLRDLGLKASQPQR